jgi:hypothetical protein
MSKSKLLGIVWAVLIAFTAWYVYKNFRPGLLK